MLHYSFVIVGAIAAFIAILVLFSGSNLSDFLRVFEIKGGDIVSVSTNATIYHYGDTIHLKVEDNNTGPTTIRYSQNDMKPYAGLPLNCANETYLAFDMLPGDYSKKNITNYDSLLHLKDKALNVINKYPPDAVMCFKLTGNVQSINIYGYSNHATITTASPFGSKSKYPPETEDRNLIEQYDIQRAYPQDIMTNPKYHYSDSAELNGQLLQPGKYTFVAFTLSGQISKPVVIEITTKPGLIASSNTSNNLSKCSGYNCKYQQILIWNQITKNADCRDTNCALDNMLNCKSVTVSALFGDGNNATVIRVARLPHQPNNGATLCEIDILNLQLLNYTYSCLPCDYYMNLKMINALIGTSEMASWHVKNFDDLYARLTYQEPSNRFAGASGKLPMSQFFSHKMDFGNPYTK
jgi:hypothetical protein